MELAIHNVVSARAVRAEFVGGDAPDFDTLYLTVVSKDRGGAEVEVVLKGIRETAPAAEERPVAEVA